MENPKYDYDYINELCNKIDLLEYAEQSYEFKKKGDKYFCSCPKHSDSDPSLCISPDVNLFYCFSCRRKGNLVNWMMEYEDLSFYDAVKKVAALTNTDLHSCVESESLSFYKLMEKLETQQKRKDPERAILDFEKDYRERFDDEIPQEWVEEGISAEVIKKYEIMIDHSSNRIVYPVYDAENNFIGIKGRTRFKNYKDLSIMKYMNYFKVGILNYFQGMKQALPFIKEKNEIIILEGLKSVMKLDGWGFHNAVSAETSTLNEYQIELLIKLQIRDVVIAFDKDVWMKKIIECTKLLKRFANVWVVYDRWHLLAEKDSPCDQGAEVWKTLYERRVML